MKGLAVLAGAVTLSLVLSGCGSSSYSFYEGFHAGQGLAANEPHGSLDATRTGAAAAAACRRDWVIAGSLGVDRAPWRRGCISGFEAVVTVVGKP
ncbi:MAG TPA: hypothetical protein VMQ40_01885 [Acidimicrobiales bacterium]|jgi:hypothetical protein|nr:hypothetical protein [Acidimicrobiales bacterium]